MTEGLLSDDIKNQVKEVFNQLKDPVQVLFFGRKEDCEYCADTLQLVQEVLALSYKLGLSEYDIEDDAALARQYKVDKTPGLVFAGKDGDQLVDYGVRMAGIPSGHEFTSLIHDLLLVSGRDSGLSENTRQVLSRLTKPVHMQVFVTPT